MARGWESKSVESQIEEAATGKERDRDRWDLDRVRLKEKRDGLLLARTRALGDLSKASHPRYRKMLEDKLDFLGRELEDLENAL
jgi:hypothetical protein